jgi:hypothetical protein
MKTEFYGTRLDLHEICRFAFTEPGLEVWESYSELNRELRCFHSIEQVEDALPALHTEEPEPGILLMLWSPAMRGEPVAERISLGPGAFRYRFGGWGLINLNLAAGHAGELRRSSMSHTNEARAERLFNFIGHPLGSLADWDWEQVERIGQTLHAYVRQRMAVAKSRRAIVLRDAERLRAAGKVLLTP